MRPHRPRSSVPLAAAIALALSVVAPPVAGQDDEGADALTDGAVTLARPALDVPLTGTVLDDGTIVLDDADYCSYLLGVIWGAEPIVPAGDAETSAARPFEDEATLARCVDALRAFLTAPAEADDVPDWARTGPVVPRSLAARFLEDVEGPALAGVADVTDEGVFIDGRGSVTTDPFTLGGGSYFADVDAFECSSWSGRLRSVDDPAYDVVVADGGTFVDGVASGDHYWEISASDCEWFVDLLPFDDDASGTDPPVRVPDIVGLPRDEAISLLNELRLEVHTCQVVRDPQQDSDRIVLVDPPAGTEVEPGSALRVHVDWPSSCEDFPLTEGADVR